MIQRYNLRNKNLPPDLVYQIEALIKAVESPNGGSADRQQAAFTAAQQAEIDKQIKVGLFGAFAQAPIGVTTPDPLLQNIPTGNGTVTTFTAGDLSPLFTTTETTPTTTPALSFTAINQNANVFYAGPSSGAAAVPVFRALVAADFPYKVYTALITQTSTNAPVATVLANTLGGTLVWTRTSAGDYLGTLAGVFTASKTTALITGDETGLSLNVLYYVSRASVNTVRLQTYSLVDSTQEDDLMAGTTLELRVYP